MDAPENTTHDTSAADRATLTAPPDPGRRGCFTVVLGVLTVLVGIPMLVCPGPGMATIAAGLGMIAVGFGLRRPKEP